MPHLCSVVMVGSASGRSESSRPKTAASELLMVKQKAVYPCERMHWTCGSDERLSQREFPARRTTPDAVPATPFPVEVFGSDTAEPSTPFALRWAVTAAETGGVMFASKPRSTH